MSKAIYTFKLSLLQHQFPEFNWQKKRNVEKMGQFIVFTCTLSPGFVPPPPKAASSDLNLYSRSSVKCIKRYLKVEPQLEYLIEELI